MGIQQVQTKASHPHRSGPVLCVVVHSTGDTDLDKIVHYYSTSDHGIGPHYLIACDGSVTQFVDEDRVAYHAGFGDGQVELYRQGWDVWSRYTKDSDEPQPETFPGYQDWRATWPTLNSPLDLVTGQHPNGVSVGIECQEPPHRLPNQFTDEQYASLRELVGQVAQRYAIQLDRQHVLGHSDVNPISRSTSKGGYDPGLCFRWERLLSADG